ncbi:hypothetical protein OG339_48205 (plasmid) [Streptosporangium sp. NBC_01495]|uniref:hypothetical protein n=1 Tax=Streptosporangium sp. NBC_01495 TaxID=2903899 RepID=UPI002E32DA54|nr:hypothetical protein [Streptosporangium sp. NBC_01495]
MVKRTFRPAPTPSKEITANSVPPTEAPGGPAQQILPHHSPAASRSSDTTAPGSMLRLSATTVDLQPAGSATLTLTAVKGPIRWKGLTTGPLILHVSPADTTLAAGQSTTVRILAADTSSGVNDHFCDSRTTGQLIISWSNTQDTTEGVQRVTVRRAPCASQETQ